MCDGPPTFRSKNIYKYVFKNDNKERKKGSMFLFHFVAAGPMKKRLLIKQTSAPTNKQSIIIFFYIPRAVHHWLLALENDPYDLR